MFKIFSFIICLLCGFNINQLNAQGKGSLTFAVEEYDFKEIEERSGPAAYSFEFVNTGSSPIVISKVKASCGCTTPAWSKDPVLPGAKGFVTAEYNPFNRPGSFRKSLTITSNAENGSKVVYIKGKVLPRVKTIEEKMTYKSGNIRFKSKTMNFGKISTEKKVSKNFDIYNEGDSAISFLTKIDKPDFIEVVFESYEIGAKEMSRMTIFYDPQHEDKWGYNNHGITLYTNEPSEESKTLNVVSTISEYFPEMSAEDLESAPKLLIAERFQDLGRLNKGEKVVAEFVLTNSGKSDLNIRAVKSNCACFIVKQTVEGIKSGQSVVLNTEFNSAGRRGGQNKSITIYSNDPTDPTQVVSVKAFISTN